MSPKTDMFLTKKQTLINWMRARKIFSTSDIIKWNTENYSNRGCQYKADFLRAGIIRKLSDYEKSSLGYNTKQDVCKFIEQPAPSLANWEGHNFRSDPGGLI